MLVGLVVLVLVSVMSASVTVDVAGAVMVTVVVLVGLVVLVVVFLSAAVAVEISGAVKVRRTLSAVVAAAFVSFSVVGWAAVAFWKSCGFSASLAAACVDDRWAERQCCGRSSRAARFSPCVDGKKCFCFAAAAGVVGSFDGFLVVSLELSWRCIVGGSDSLRLSAVLHLAAVVMSRSVDSGSAAYPSL